MLMHDERGFAVRTRTEIGCARLSDDPVSATDRGMAVKMEQLQRAYDRQACDACAFLQDDIFGQDQRRTDPAFRMQLESEKSPQHETSHAPGEWDDQHLPCNAQRSEERRVGEECVRTWRCGR